MKKQYLIFGLCSVLFAASGYAADFPVAGTARVVASDYGLIQNVSGYSSNPFYSPGNSYNKNIVGKPIYARGTDVKTSECQIMVAGLIAAECSRQNNCNGMQLMDIRPNIMVKLSNMSGGNYITSCSGYIDTAFQDYVNNARGRVTGSDFPSDSVMIYNGIVTNPEFVIAPKPNKNTVSGRAAELQALQNQNSDGVGLIATQMPGTVGDLSFADRNANTAAGLEQWKDAKVYNPIEIESDETRLKREQTIAQLEKSVDYCKWCKKNTYACKKEIQTEIDRLNNELRSAACSAGMPSVILWRIDDKDPKCGIEKKLDKEEMIDDLSCGGFSGGVDFDEQQQLLDLDNKAPDDKAGPDFDPNAEDVIYIKIK